MTAPLAHLRHLDLDEDRRAQLGFADRAQPLTVRQLLSHSAGLPPWLPFTGEPLAAQLRRGFPEGAHPKLVPGVPGTSLYSDLGYRLLAELLERQTGVPFPELGARASGLDPAPWAVPPPFAPQGPDLDMWRLAEPGLPFPPGSPPAQRRQRPGGNARPRRVRNGRPGPEGLPGILGGFRRPHLMARDAARATAPIGVWVSARLHGPGRFGALLEGTRHTGVHVLEWTPERLSPPVPEAPPGPPSGFWYPPGLHRPRAVLPAGGRPLRGHPPAGRSRGRQ